eukprot:scaffold4475_cov42-Attheya_sp.AAC.4
MPVAYCAMFERGAFLDRAGSRACLLLSIESRANLRTVPKKYRKHLLARHKPQTAVNKRADGKPPPPSVVKVHSPHRSHLESPRNRARPLDTCRLAGVALRVGIENWGVGIMVFGIGTSRHFAGEPFLDHPPPNYEYERHVIVLKIVLAVIVLVIVPPLVLRHKMRQRERSVVQETASRPQPHKQKPNKRRAAKTTEVTVEQTTTRPKESVANEEGVPPLLLLMCNVLCWGLIIWWIAGSPYNSYSARAIFEAPLFTTDECNEIIAMAHRAAERNYETVLRDTESSSSSLLEDPKGWEKDRHGSYPTTDLNLVTDSFTSEDRAVLRDKLSARLAPLMERTQGVTPGALRVNDMFVVRYDAKKGQPSLQAHTDSCHISFNILLNDEFEGGGTRFFNRNDESNIITVHPSHVGNVILSPALVRHEGLATTKGIRYILVGFTSVDTQNPLTHEPTGLSLFASWLSLAWIQTKLRESSLASYSRLDNVNRAAKTQDTSSAIDKKWFDNKYVRAGLREYVQMFVVLCDWWSPHFHVDLVSCESRDSYLQALDDYRAVNRISSNNNNNEACWFEGQQLKIDLDGTVSQELGEPAVPDL